MDFQRVPASTQAHRDRLDRLTLAMLLAIRQLWRQLDPGGRGWERQYADDLGPKIYALVLAAQVAATRESNQYVPAVLAELGVATSGETPQVPLNVFAGYAGDGRPLDTLLAGTIGRARASFARRRDVATSPLTDFGPDGDTVEIAPAPSSFDTDLAHQLALQEAESVLQMLAETVVSDTARAAESAVMTAQPAVDGYYRMLKPPSCSRCVVLAGRFYRWNSGFLRHPRCDCVHIPAREADFGDLRLGVAAYFDSLTGEQQDRIFTAAGARAIRDGADPVRFVNARRGMERAQEGAQLGLLITRESTTRRGAANRARAGRNAVVRLMPESIYDVARDRDDAVRLLRLNGYLT